MTIYYAVWLAQFVRAHAACVDITHSFCMYVKVCIECMGLALGAYIERARINLNLVLREMLLVSWVKHPLI